MYKDRKNRTFIICTLIFVLLLMAGAYAAFQTRLDVSGTSKVTSNWDVKITNISSGTPTGTAENATTPTWTDLTAYMEANLYEKGDSMEYDVTISNRGTFDAKLDDIITTPSSNDAVIITYTGYTKGEMLPKGQDKVIHVKIAYNPSYKGGDATGISSVEFQYVQGEGSNITPDGSQYVLTYNCTTNGGIKGNAEDEKIAEGSTVSLTGKTCGQKLGYTFTGWNTSANASTTINEITVNSNTTLYGLYTPNTYSISYSLNGGTHGTNHPNSGTYDSNVQISNPTKTITITGNANETGATVGANTTGNQTFTGWTSSTVGEYAKTGNTSTPTTKWTGTITKNTYFKNLKESGTVTLTANWGGGTVTLPTLSKTGNTCSWYNTSTGGTEIGESGDTWTIPTGNSTQANITTYARCVANIYQISLDDQDATTSGTEKIYEKYDTGYYTDSTTSTQMTTSNNGINVPTKTGHTFGGYYTETNGNGTQYISATGKLTSNASTTHFNSDGTLYAKWTANTYTITLNNQDATTPGTETIYEKYNDGYYLDVDTTNKMTSSTNPITKPTKPGYNFDGYYTGTNGSGTKYIDENGNITEHANTTNFVLAGNLYAKWVDAPPTINNVATIVGATTVTAVVSADVGGDSSLIAKYEFSIDGTNWIDNGTSNIYTFDELDRQTNYDIKVRVTSVADLTTTSDDISVTTEALEPPRFTEAITSTETIVTVHYLEDCTTYTCTYQKNNGEVMTVTDDEVDVAFADVGTITASISDGTHTVTRTYSVDFNGSFTIEDEETITSTNVITWVAPATGEYYLQVWGAQGGTMGSKTGGKGGYSYGYITLNEGDTLYIHNGGQGSTGTGGTNGGGKGVSGTSAGGGGGTDIRVETDSLYARVIVAGGGAGAGQDSCATATNGYGGGLSGGGGTSQGSCGTQAGAGTQTTGGVGGLYSSTRGASGTFGQGGNASNGSYDGGGGGGGWYGGGAGASAGWSNAGGGGSGYVYTEDTASNYPEGCLLSEQYHLRDAATVGGNIEFDSPTGTKETGHTGNGSTKITYNIENVFNNRLTLSVNNVTTNSISVTATPGEGVNITKYEFSSDNGATWTSNGASNTYIFTGLTHNTIYNLKVRGTTSAGKVIASAEGTTNVINAPTFSNDTTTTGSISTTITYPSGCGSTFTCAYQKDGEEVQIVTNQTAIVSFTSPGTVTATVTDGTNTVSDSHTPVETITLSKSTSTTTKSITVTANVTNSTGVAKYEFTNDGGETWIDNGTNNVYTFNDLTYDTYPINVRVTTNFGNSQTSTAINVTPNPIDPPTYSQQNNAVDDVDITITYPEGCGSTFTCQYIKDNDSPVTVTSTTAIVNFSEDGELTATVTDGHNTINSNYTVIMPTLIEDHGLDVLTGTSCDGELVEDSTEPGRYIYKGSNPCNYITLGTDTYRIIAIEPDGTLKVIKQNTIGSIVWDPGYSTTLSGITSASSNVGTRYSSTSTDFCYASSASSYSGCKSWGSNTTTLDSSGNNVTRMPWTVGGTTKNLPASEAYLNVYLNGGTYKDNSITGWVDGRSYKSLIETHTFNIGPTSTSLNLDTLISEAQTYKWNGKVGLMTDVDLYKSETIISKTSNLISYLGHSSSNEHEWTMTPASNSYSYSVYNVYFTYTQSVISRNALIVRPVFHLTPCVQLSGDGKSGTPYTVTNSSTCGAVNSPTFSDAVSGQSINTTITFQEGCGSLYTCTYQKNDGPVQTVTSTTQVVNFTEEGTLIATVTNGDRTKTVSHNVVENLTINKTIEATSKSITVTANVTNSTGVTKYEFTNDGGTTWIDNGTNNVYTFNDLTQGTTYPINVRVTTNFGTEQTSTVTNKTTTAIANPTYSETLNGENDVDVTITYPEGCGTTYTCAYIKDNENPVTVTSTTATVNFDADGELAATVTDGYNIISSTYTFVMPTLITDHGLHVWTGTSCSGELVEDPTEPGRYIYRGIAPCNYIRLGSNSDTYRIISFEPDGTLKVVKEDSIGNKAFDYGYTSNRNSVESLTNYTRYVTEPNDYCSTTNSYTGYYGCNAWGSATTTLNSNGSHVSTMPSEPGGTELTLPASEAYLNVYLNGGTYRNDSLTGWINSQTFKTLIETHSFDVGPVKSETGQTLATDTSQSHAYTWRGNVGLMTVIDYVKANSNTSSCGTVYLNDNDTTCKTTNYLHSKTQDTQWTMSPRGTSTTSGIWVPYCPNSSSTSCSTSYGSIRATGTDTSYNQGTRPAFYLASCVQLSGSGSSTNPYTVSNSSTCTGLKAPTYSETINASDGIDTTITYPSGCGSEYTCTYTKDNGTPVTVTSTTETVTFDADGELVATVSDGTNTNSSTYVVFLPRIVYAHNLNASRKEIGKGRIKSGVEAYTSINDERIIKYKIDRNYVVQDAWACIKYDFLTEPVCLHGGNTSYMQSNLDILMALSTNEDFINAGGQCTYITETPPNYYPYRYCAVNNRSIGMLVDGSSMSRVFAGYGIGGSACRVITGNKTYNVKAEAYCD